MIAVVDYGMGNLRSMGKALEAVGGDVLVTADAADLRDAERIVLPGVGAFGEAIANLRATGLVEAMEEEVLRKGKPFLGVCVGMQLLARESVEHGRHTGLGWIEADVLPIELCGPDIRVPHTGWNALEVVGGSDGLSAGAPPRGVLLHALLPRRAAGRRARRRALRARPFARRGRCADNILAVQFHPEKSQQAGLEFLADFLAWEPTLAAAS